VDAAVIVLALGTAALLALAGARRPPLVREALAASGRLVSTVWLELAFGFLIAGLVEVLLPARTLASALGAESGARGHLVAWALGLAVPGGPYVFFPLVTGLVQRGAAVGPVLTLVAAKTLLSPIRLVTFEAPLLGWRLALARALPALLAPPLLGLAGDAVARLLVARAR
jgi:uncharacterized membrane protein YraQ (UPF0718 family)